MVDLNGQVCELLDLTELANLMMGRHGWRALSQRCGIMGQRIHLGVRSIEHANVLFEKISVFLPQMAMAYYTSRLVFLNQMCYL